jgi:hypothetical protein
MGGPRDGSRERPQKTVRSRSPPLGQRELSTLSSQPVFLEADVHRNQIAWRSSDSRVSRIAWDDPYVPAFPSPQLRAGRRLGQSSICVRRFFTIFVRRTLNFALITTHATSRRLRSWLGLATTSRTGGAELRAQCRRPRPGDHPVEARQAFARATARARRLRARP